MYHPDAGNGYRDVMLLKKNCNVVFTSTTLEDEEDASPAVGR